MKWILIALGMLAGLGAGLLTWFATTVRRERRRLAELEGDWPRYRKQDDPDLMPEQLQLFALAQAAAAPYAGRLGAEGIWSDAPEVWWEEPGHMGFEWFFYETEGMARPVDFPVLWPGHLLDPGGRPEKGGGRHGDGRSRLTSCCRCPVLLVRGALHAGLSVRAGRSSKRVPSWEYRS